LENFFKGFKDKVLSKIIAKAKIFDFEL